MLIVAWWHLYLAALATHPLPVKASVAGYGAWRTGRQRAGGRASALVLTAWVVPTARLGQPMCLQTMFLAVMCAVVWIMNWSCHHPCLQALTSAGLAATSDGIAQRLLGAKRLAWRRCMLMAMFGLLWYGACPATPSSS
jgi:hypothetical protein